MRISARDIKKLYRGTSFLLCLTASMTLGGQVGYAIQIPVITNTSFFGGTSYGASGYVQLGNANPTYIANNVTGYNDILNSPGGGYQTANPVIANNVASVASLNSPYVFGWIGGVAPLSGATFGSGLTLTTASSVAFGLSDTTVGCCTASYMITSIIDSYTVNNAAYTGTFGAFLSIVGTNFTAGDSGVASAIVEYNINGMGWNFMPQMVLAAGGNCNDVAIGGSGAAVINGGCNGGYYEGLSVDNLGNVNWAVGTTIQIKATITAYADPASGDTIGSYLPDANLIETALGGPTGTCPTGDSTCLPGFTGQTDTGVSDPLPEPATFGLSGFVLASAYLLRRRLAR